jgi:hypothetical protein
MKFKEWFNIEHKVLGIVLWAMKFVVINFGRVMGSLTESISID